MFYRKQAGIGCSILALAISAQTATAQDTASAQPQANDIIVTGSRIARRDLVAPSPIVTASAEALQATAQPTVDAALLQMPAFQPGAGSFSNSSTGGTVGQSTLNLRGLGAQRNLVLLEGRRLQPGSIDSTIDINTIPSLAIGNVEVISGGASATYGSDAMSGVVNFKLRKNFRGLEMRAQAGISGQGDAGNQQLGVLYGTAFAEGRGSLIISGEYAHRSVLSSQDRDFSKYSATSGFISQGYYVPQAGNFASQAALNSVFGKYGVAAGTVTGTTNLGFNQNGSLFTKTAPAYNYQGPTTNPYVSTPTAFGYNSNFYNFIQVPLKRYNIFAHSEFEVDDHTTLYAQGLYNDTSASTQSSQPILAAPWQLDIPVTNPFIPADLKTLLASRANPTATFTFNKRADEAGPRAFTTEGQTYQGLVGAKGKLTGLDGSWDLYASYGEGLNKDITTSGAMSMSAARTLINAPDGGASICAGGYNPFGITQLSDSCRAYLMRRLVNKTKVTQTAIEGTMEGRLFHLPAGNVRFAVTAGYRRNTYKFNPDAASIGGDISSITATQPTTGATSVAEGAVELLVPLLADTPLAREVNLDLGYRYSHYNVSGGVSAYKASLDWRVAKMLLLRGGYQHSVRAPNIGELFLAPSQTVTNIGLPPSAGDPCDARSAARAGANAAKVQALCIATGINPALYNSFTQPTTSIVTQTQGNSQLTPEKADTFTAGAVLQSPATAGLFRRMSLTVDYYNIKISQAISPLAANVALQKCFNTDGSNPNYDASNYFCKLFGRDATSGLFTTASQPYLNLGGYKTSGIDAQFDWHADFADLGLGGKGGVTLNVEGNYLSQFDIQVLPGSAYQNWAGTISSTASYPRFKLLTNLAVDIGKTQISGRWRHTSGFTDSSRVTSASSTVPGTPAYDYFDLSARVKVSDKFELRGSVNNVFDKQPPIVGGVAGTTNLGVYDVVGRAFMVSATARY